MTNKQINRLLFRLLMIQLVIMAVFSLYVSHGFNRFKAADSNDQSTHIILNHRGTDGKAQPEAMRVIPPGECAKSFEHFQYRLANAASSVTFLYDMIAWNLEAPASIPAQALSAKVSSPSLPTVGSPRIIQRRPMNFLDPVSWSFAPQADPLESD